MDSIAAIKFVSAWADVNGLRVPLPLRVKMAVALKSAAEYDRAIKEAVTAEYEKPDDKWDELFIALIIAMLLQAFKDTWKSQGGGDELPAFLALRLAAMQAEQEAFVRQFKADIDAASAAGEPLEPFLVRAELWSNRYNEAENEALQLIAAENKTALVWHYGDTDHCSTCADLDGMIAYPEDWRASGLHPQNGPNPLLECGGYRCQCRWDMTNEKPAPDALDRLMEIAGRSL